MTITAREVKTFADRFIAAGLGDLVDALIHLRDTTGFQSQTLLWLYSGKVQNATRQGG